MNGFPPEGVYVIISSDTVTVTNQTVDIGTEEVQDKGSEPGDGSDEGTDGASDVGGDSDEKSE